MLSVVFLITSVMVVNPAISVKAAWEDTIPSRVVRQGLTEATARADSTNVKPIPALYSGTSTAATGISMQSEVMHFTDMQFGTHIWKISNDPRSTFAHNTLGISPWNADGSLLGLLTHRRYPGRWPYPDMANNSAAPGTIVMNTDGSSSEMTHLALPSGVLFRVNSTRHVAFTWDRFNPDIYYIAGSDGLYAVDIMDDSRIPVKVASFQETSRYKTIYGPASGSGLILVSDDLGNNYQGVNIYVVNPYAHTAVQYPLRLNLDYPAGHDQSKENSFHGMYFAGGSDDIIFHYGPYSSTGEPYFYIARDGIFDSEHVSLLFDNTGSTPLPYLSHPSFSSNGQYVAYGGNTVGGSNYGSHVLNFRTDEHVKTLMSGAGGHYTYNSNDPDLVVFSSRDGVFGGTLDQTILSKGYVSGAPNNAVPFVNTYGAPSNGAYVGMARPELSPDGTKVFYHSGMLSKNFQSGADGYVAVVRAPLAPLGLTLEGSSLTWNAPEFSAEARGYHIYRSENGESYEKVNTEIILKNQTSFALNDLAEGTEYYYGVVMEENSGLQSDNLSNIIKVVWNGSSYSAEPVSGTVTDFDTTAPNEVGEPVITEYVKESTPANVNLPGTFYCYNRLDWSSYTPNEDVWYYNIYYSVEGVPSATPDRLIASVPASEGKTYIDWQARLDVEQNSHFYFITAVDHKFNESSVVVVNEAPAAPTGLSQVGQASPYQVNIWWTASSTAGGEPEPTGYNIYVNGSQNAYVLSPGTSYTINNLTPETSYTVTVTALNGTLESAHSNELTVTTGADPRKNTYAARAGSNLTIDGNLDESDWNITVPIDKLCFGTVGSNRAYFGLLWDENNLYIGARAYDNDVVDGGGSIYQNDSFSINLNGDGNRGGSYTSTDYEIEITCNGRITNIGSVVGAAVLTGDGFTVEVAVPWSRLGRTPAEGMSFGFDIAENDRTTAAQRRGQLIWSGDADNWTSTTNFGVATLSTDALPQPSTIIVTGPGSVANAQTFTVDIGFQSPDEIFNADIVVEYNPDLVEYVDYTKIAGGLDVIPDDTDVPGILHFLLAAGPDGAGAITEETKLIELEFRAKAVTGACSIEITQAILAKEGDLINGVKILPSLDSITVSVMGLPIPGDINNDSVVDIMDFYAISINYGKTSTDANWDIIHVADVSGAEIGVPDGEIGLADLVFVALKIFK